MKPASQADAPAVRHVMKDGREMKDITNYVVPINDKTILAYETLMRRDAQKSYGLNIK